MEHKIYTCDAHTLPIDRVDRHALYIMEKLVAEGHVAYLVGGSVRDLLLGKRPKDFDISTSAEPEEIKKIFRNCILIGRRFRLAHIRFGRKIIEVSTFRSGDPEADSLITRDNVWGSPEDDAVRRDFTINGLFYEPGEQIIIDYVGGFPDTQKKLLRTIGQPHLRFKQDPVRMIRLLKFQARFGFDVDNDTRIALLENKQEILKSSQARVLEELLKMLESGASRSFFHLLTEHGFTQHLLPELGAFLEGPDHNDVYAFLEEIDSRFEKPFAPPFERPILISSLLFPILQKRIRTRYLDREKSPHLGEIQNEVHGLLKETFQPFFHLSRRLKMAVHTILTTQYRFTPLEKRRRYRLRIPKDPSFPLAMQFFELRTHLEPALGQMWNEWNQAFSEAPPQKPHRPNRRKPGPRRPRRPSSEE